MKIRVRASSGHRFLNCPLSVELEKKFKKEETTVYASQGTLEHEIAADYLNRNIVPLLNSDKGLNEDELSKLPLGVSEYIRTIYGTLKDKKNSNVLPVFLLERKLSFSEALSEGNNLEGSGSPDFVAVYDKEAFVFDYKSGGIKVFVRKNPQLYLYALSVYHLFKNMGQELDTFHLIIVQPKEVFEERITISRDELLEFQKWVKERTSFIGKKDAPIEAGRRQCEYCPVRHDCGALRNKVGAYYKLLDKEDITNEELYLLIKNFSTIKQYNIQLRKEVFEKINNGGEFEGYRIHTTNPNTRWTKEAESVLFDLLGESAYNKKRKSTSKLFEEKLIRPQKHSDLLEYRLVGEKLAIDWKNNPTNLETIEHKVGEVISPFVSDEEKRYFLDNYGKLEALKKRKELEMLELLKTKEVKGFMSKDDTVLTIQKDKEQELEKILGEKLYNKKLIPIYAVKKLKVLSDSELSEITEKPEVGTSSLETDF